MRWKNKSGRVVWTEISQNAFENLKAQLVLDPVLLIPACGRELTFVVTTDAANVGFGAVLLYENLEGDLRPCVYHACKLHSAKQPYSLYNIEVLAIAICVIQTLRIYLESGWSFSVIADHATLPHLLKQSGDKLTPRQSRYVERLLPFAGYMSNQYRKGSGIKADPVS